MPAVYQNRNTLKEYFQTGDFPTQAQFAALIDAFYHRSDDQAPISFINGLTDVLNGKASVESIATMQTILTALQIEVEGMLNADQVINYTYAQLVGRALSNQLIPGRWYKITDFAQAHNLYDGATGEIVSSRVGATEAIYVMATTTSGIAQNVLSSTYPQDVIRYSLFGNEDTSDIGYFDDLGNPVENFKGKIYFRHDTRRNIKAWYDWRNVEFRSWAVDSPEWVSNTSYNVGDCVKDLDEKIYVCMRVINDAVHPANQSNGSWLLLYDLPGYMNDIGNNISFTKNVEEFCLQGNLNPNRIWIDSGSFNDFKTFSTTKLSNISIGKLDKTENALANDFYTSLPNIIIKNNNQVNFIRDIEIGDNCYNLRIIGDEIKQNSKITNTCNCICTGVFTNSEINNCSFLILQGLSKSKINYSSEMIFTKEFMMNEVNAGLVRVVLPNAVKNTVFVAQISDRNALETNHLLSEMSKFVILTDDSYPLIQYVDSNGVQTSPFEV
jgi:hypothetical protein